MSFIPDNNSTNTNPTNENNPTKTNSDKESSNNNQSNGNSGDTNTTIPTLQDDLKGGIWETPDDLIEGDLKSQASNFLKKLTQNARKTILDFNCPDYTENEKLEFAILTEVIEIEHPLDTLHKILVKNIFISKVMTSLLLLVVAVKLFMDMLEI